MLGEHQDFDDEIGLVLHFQQAGMQASRQASRQAGRQAGRQAATNREVTNLGHDSFVSVRCWVRHGLRVQIEVLTPLSEGTHGRCDRLKPRCNGSPNRDP